MAVVDDGQPQQRRVESTRCGLQTIFDFEEVLRGAGIEIDEVIAGQIGQVDAQDGPAAGMSALVAERSVLGGDAVLGLAGERSVLEELADEPCLDDAADQFNERPSRRLFRQTVAGWI